MAHDYAPNNEYFINYIKDKIWNWHEIQDSDLVTAMKKNHLIKSEYFIDFRNFVWLSLYKER